VPALQLRAGGHPTSSQCHQSFGSRELDVPVTKLTGGPGKRRGADLLSESPRQSGPSASTPPPVLPGNTTKTWSRLELLRLMLALECIKIAVPEPPTGIFLLKYPFSKSGQWQKLQWELGQFVVRSLQPHRNTLPTPSRMLFKELYTNAGGIKTPGHFFFNHPSSWQYRVTMRSTVQSPFLQ